MSEMSGMNRAMTMKPTAPPRKQMSKGSMSFTYGLSVDEARPYLKLPKGQKLVHNGKELELVELRAAK